MLRKMPVKNLTGRFDRSKIAPLKLRRSETSHGFHKPKFVQRQGLPQNNFLPPGQTSGDGDSQDEGDDGAAGESGDEEDDSNTPNPFEPVTTTTSQDQSSITAPSKTSNYPFITPSTTGSSSTSTSTASSLPTSTDITTTTTSQELLSTSSTVFSSLSTASTSVVPLPDSRTGLAAPASTSAVAASETVSASNHPVAKVAVIVPTLLGAVAAVAAAYLLFRYCNPLKARWAIYRARKGQRLPGEEEDGMAPKAAPQMSEVHAMRTEDARRSSLRPPSTVATPAPSFTRGTAIALPLTTTRAPPPVLVRNGSKNKPSNGVVSDQLARSQSASSRRSSRDNAAAPTAYTSGGYGTYAFDFNVEEYAGPRNPDSQTSHPNGLANNPPTPVARNSTAPSGSGDEAMSPVPSLPSPIGLVSGLGMEFPLPPSTPSAAHFPTPTPPESTFNSPRRLRKSITPSESISNVPDSPFPFSPALMPPVPLMNSRWSRNSSSVNGRMSAATSTAAAAAEEKSTRQLRHSAGPGLVDTTSPPLRSPPPKKKSSSLVSPPP